MQGAEWAIDGCLYCYSSVFLLSCGLNNTLIGVLLSLLTGGVLLDRFGVPALLLTGAGALAAGTVILFCSAEPAPPQTC